MEARKALLIVSGAVQSAYLSEAERVMAVRALRRLAMLVEDDEKAKGSHNETCEDSCVCTRRGDVPDVFRL